MYGMSKTEGWGGGRGGSGYATGADGRWLMKWCHSEKGEGGLRFLQAAMLSEPFKMVGYDESHKGQTVPTP